MAELINVYPEASMPPAGSYGITQKSDSDKGLWYGDGTALRPVSNHLTKQVNFAADGTTTAIGTIPANSIVKGVTIAVTEVFNAGTTNTIAVGISGTANKFAAATAVTALGLATGADGIDTGGLLNGKGHVATAQAVIATFNQTGTAASTGKAIVSVEFIPAPAIT